VAQIEFVTAQRPALRRAVEADALIRSVLFIAAFLAVCFSFHPFQSLADAQPTVNSGSDLLNQIGFSVLFLALAAVTAHSEPRRLLLLLRPLLIAVLAWCVLTAVTSWEPSLAARRLAFTMMFMSISAMALLMPKNLRHFGSLMAAVALIVLAACYLGLVFAPSLSIHQATDFLEPEHAGDWRGIFAQKNTAGAVMVLFIFTGMFVARARSLVLGAVIVALAAVFLLFTQSKTDIGMLPLVMILAAVIGRSRRPALGIILVVVPLALVNLFTVGSIYFEPARNVVGMIMPDETFTGRTEIWELALRYAAQRPILGYGFSAFWGTEQIVFKLGETATWANGALDAHNAYVNLALTIGIPGAILAILWLVVLPLVDYYRAPSDPSTDPLKMLFLRICLFAAYGSCFESIFFSVGAIWFFLTTATFGLRFLSVSRVTQ
jgi:O-antigen ligase